MMIIPDMEPYILGRVYSQVIPEPARLTEDIYKKAVDTLYTTYTGVDNLKLCETPKSFYNAEPDMRAVIPEELRSECFYAMSLGLFSDQVPAKCLYMIKKAYDKYRIPNLIFKQFTESDFRVMCQDGYLSPGICLRDVVCTLVDKDYRPISKLNPVIRHETYAEVYVAATDMVAALPLPIVDSLSPSDIRELDVDTNGLHIGHHYLRCLAGYVGAINSVYDLRELI